MVKKWFMVTLLAMSLIMLFFINGCTTTSIRPTNEHKPLEGQKYAVLGTVRYETKWHGIIGMQILKGLGISLPPNLGFDLYLIRIGGANYDDFLSVARRKYPSTDAIVDITVDYMDSPALFSIIYSQSTIIMTGIAIRYDKEPSSSNTVSEVPSEPTRPNVPAKVEPSIPAHPNIPAIETTTPARPNVVVNYTVERVTGQVQSQRNFEDVWVDVKVGDVFTENNRIRTALNASLVLNDGSRTITITGGKEGRIDSLLRMGM